MKYFYTDTRGKQSKTLPLVYIAFTVATFRFLLAGVSGPWGTLPDFSGVDYAAAIVAILGIWTARESKEKSLTNAE